jgi:hypothetical protein
MRVLSVRLFAGARRVRYAWRPAGPRAEGPKLGPAARRPPRIDGAIPVFSESKTWFFKKTINIPNEKTPEHS